MRAGTMYRRCGRCGRTVQDPRGKRCPNCGGERISWAYKVDVAPPGARRVPRSQSGFATKREALEAMARLQTGRLDGTYVEPSKLTVGQYLDDWLAGGPTRGWRGNTARDYRVGVGHIKLRLADVPLQALTFAQIEALYGYLLTEAGSLARRAMTATAGWPARRWRTFTSACGPRSTMRFRAIRPSSAGTRPSVPSPTPGPRIGSKC